MYHWGTFFFFWKMTLKKEKSHCGVVDLGGEIDISMAGSAKLLSIMVLEMA